MEIVMAKSLLNANTQIAEGNRSLFDGAGVYVVNLLGSPGAGKTTLLEAMLPGIKERLRPAVIEGDLNTSRDADRIAGIGVPSVQINTGGGCHLDANMVMATLPSIELGEIELLFIENVGNLVCTASFALGEHLRVVVLSVTEGDDKVEKYLSMFRKADAVVLNKADLLPYIDFDVERVRSDLERLGSQAPIFRLSARTGEGLDLFVEWLLGRRAKDHPERARNRSK
jgi:hydrogenase nickel incorporation protein HypB